MNILDRLVDLYYSARFAIEDSLYAIKNKFSSKKDEEYSFDEVIEKKPKKKKKKSKKK